MAAVQGIKLIEGKVVDVQRRTAGGFVRGSVVVEGYGADQGRLVRIEIQNENLVALEDGQVRVIVPDLITLVDSQTADAVATETVRYGQRVAVNAMPCDPMWRKGAASKWLALRCLATTSTMSRWRCSMPRKPDLRLGIDVGGTNTDAVIMPRILKTKWLPAQSSPRQLTSRPAFKRPSRRLWLRA
ncbi:MAG: hypothetical protein V9E81_03350 [Marmoricola sp.]